MAEGTTQLPTDSASVKQLGLFDGTNFYHSRAASTSGAAAGAIPLPVVVAHLWDPGSTTYRPARSANGSADGLAGTSNQITAPWLFNESTWDRQRANTTATLLASAARTTTTATSALTNYNGRGISLLLAVTAKAASTTLTLRILDGTGARVIASSSAFAAAVSTSYVLQCYPGVVAADFTGTGSAEGKSIVLPRSYVVQVVHSDASSITYSLTGDVIL